MTALQQANVHRKPADREGWLTRRRQHLLIIALLTLPILLPLVIYGLPATGDGRLHLLRLEALDFLVRQGFLYPRWTPELALGYGYPVFNYYSPSTYALVEMFHLAGLSHVHGMIATMGIMSLLTGYGMYMLAGDIFDDDRRRGEWAALLAAVAYMYAPYFLTNMYMRGALAEAGAQVLLPWILWSFRRLLLDDRPARYVLPAALSLGGLAVTHNITLLWIPLLLAGYIIAVYWQGYGRQPFQWRRLGWVIAGGLAAMTVSAFFWLPLVGERGFLDTYAYTVSTYLIPYHNWTWANFLDWRLVFRYTEEAPFQLGVMQLGMALVGLLMVRKWRAEWVYLIIVAMVSTLGIAKVSEPIWLNNQLLLIAQFPWRLLSILTLPLAIFTGGIVTRLPTGRSLAWGTGLLITLVVIFNHPPIGWSDTTVIAANDDAGIDLRLSTITQYELDTGALGASLGREFMPRWTDGFVRTPVPVREEINPDTKVKLVGVNSLEYDFVVNTPEQFKLLLTNFYFPGWQALLDQGTPQERVLDVFPSTQQALLSVEVPAGEHTLNLRWAGTPLQSAAVWVTLAGLLALTLFMLWHTAIPKGWALIPLLLLMLGLFGALRPSPAAAPPNPVSEPAVTPGVQLLGYRLDQPATNQAYIFPVWFVQATPDDLYFRWLLTDEAGVPVTEVAANPYFNTMRTSSWTAGAVVDDAYQITLPPELPAGVYRLSVQALSSAEDGEDSPVHFVGEVTLAENSVQPRRPDRALDLVFDDELRLDGYDMAVNGKAVAPVEPDAGRSLVQVQPGDMLEYTLYWRADSSIFENYHSLLHLLDAQRQPLLQVDQLPGPYINPPVLWNPHYAQPDVYRFEVPADTPGGLYTPRLSLYRVDDGELLPIRNADGADLGDSYFLPPVKIIGERPAGPAHKTEAEFADLATLEGYDLAPETPTLTPGAPFTVTLHYAASTATAVDYTQFVQLYSPDLGMAAQVDRPPLAGGNPTSSWVSGETIVDSIPLQVFDDAQPGRYRLQVGLYDAATGERLPILDANGAPLPDNQLILTEVELR